MSCGSFAPTSFVSSDGIYYAEKAPAETKSTLYYKNYFKEKEITLFVMLQFLLQLQPLEEKLKCLLLKKKWLTYLYLKECNPVIN